MKKILIWDISFNLGPIGGPAGYLYNLKEYLKDNSNSQIEFLSDKLPNGLIKRKKGKNLRTGILKKAYNLYWRVYANYFIDCDILPDDFDINKYDYIHFHYPIDITRHKDILKKFKGKTILTTHCPCPFTQEAFVNSHKFNILKPLLYHFEILNYKRADYLMFPCKEAREPYEKVSKIRDYFCANENKFFYVPSSIIDTKVDKQRMQTFESLGIPKDAFVITYFGRHNFIKGYDILKQLGEILLPKYPKLYFVCAGRGDIKPLKHDRWIELGFISNTHELLYQSNLYILPNRETYFDLVVLEILRSSTPIIASKTGGNKFFEILPEYNCESIVLFESQNFNELLKKTEEKILLFYSDRELYVEQCRQCRKIWESYFTMQKYITRYMDVVNNLH